MTPLAQAAAGVLMNFHGGVNIVQWREGAEFIRQAAVTNTN